jgi:hypothetical protein
LGLNSADVPPRAQPRKTSPTTRVLKELRLNFKLSLLTRLWPNATYVVAIRHPGAQLSSILQCFERGSLKELRQSLPAFTSVILGDPRFAAYREAATAASVDRTLVRPLALWWLVNYGVLLADLGRVGATFEVVLHEELSATPHRNSAQLFARCGLAWSEATADYITASSTSDPASSSATDTTRHSKRHSSTTIAQARPDVSAALETLAESVTRTTSAPGIRTYLDEYLS